MKIYEFTDIVNNTKHNILDHPLVKNIKAVYIDVPPGSVSFHHPLTIHLY